MAQLTDIKEFNMLQRNLELTKALQNVDRLTSENELLRNENSKLEDKYLERKERVRKNEIMLKSHESDITALQSKINYAINNIENRIMHTKDTIDTLEDIREGDSIESLQKGKNSIRELKIEMEAYSSFLKLIKQ